MQQILREGDYKLDRLGRSLKHLIEMTSDFEKRGIGLVSINDHIDTTTAQGRLIFIFFASLAEFERDLIRERTKSGLEAARARGRKGGRTRGLTKEAEKKAILAAKYLVEVQYHNNENGKEYFALGIMNTEGGYEVRNPYFKTNVGRKGISFIKGRREGQAVVFEGFMDFLSALTYFQVDSNLANFQMLVESDVFIMNTAKYQEKIKELLKAGNYSGISLYLDNDKTGQAVAKALIAEFPTITKDCSVIYNIRQSHVLLKTTLFSGPFGGNIGSGETAVKNHLLKICPM